MPFANGTESGNGAPSRPAQALAAADAISALQEYTRGDGLAVHELMDSRKNGGLTYNDFLMLPGKITFPAHEVSLQTRYVQPFVG
jgi:IMP dehydrogenase